MLQFEIQETSPPSKYWQILASLVVCLATINVGMFIGFTAFALPDLETTKEFSGISSNEKSWIASIVAIGMMISYPIAEICQEKLGRRKTILIMAIPLILAWILISCATDVVLFCIGRFITGLSGGCFLTVVPQYMSETLDTTLIDNFQAFHYAMVPLGVLLSFVAGFFLDWLWLSMLSSSFPIVLISCMIYLPETPHFLLIQGKIEKTKSAIKWLRILEEDYEIKLKIEEMQKNNQKNATEKRNSSLKDLFSFVVLKTTLICMFLSIFQQFSFMNILIFYCIDVLKETSISFVHPNSLALSMMGLLFFSMLLSVLFIARFKSSIKIVLYVSCIVSSISLGTLGVVCFLKAKSVIDPSLYQYVWLPIVMLYIFAYGMGLAYLPYIFSRKCLPGIFNKLSVCCGWMACFALIKTYDLSREVENYIVYWILAAVCALALPFAVYIPEITVNKKENENCTEPNHLSNTE